MLKFQVKKFGNSELLPNRLGAQSVVSKKADFETKKKVSLWFGTKTKLRDKYKYLNKKGKGFSLPLAFFYLPLIFTVNTKLLYSMRITNQALTELTGFNV